MVRFEFLRYGRTVGPFLAQGSDFGGPPTILLYGMDMTLAHNSLQLAVAREILGEPTKVRRHYNESFYSMRGLLLFQSGHLHYLPTAHTSSSSLLFVVFGSLIHPSPAPRLSRLHKI